MAFARLPVKYQPGGAVPASVTRSCGKSAGRQRIQYSVGGPDGAPGSGAVTTSASFSTKTSGRLIEDAVVSLTEMVPPPAFRRSVVVFAPRWQRIT